MDYDLGTPASGYKRVTSYHQNMLLTKTKWVHSSKDVIFELTPYLTTNELDFQGSSNLNTESTAAAHRCSLYFKAGSALVSVHLELQHVQFSA